MLLAHFDDNAFALSGFEKAQHNWVVFLGRLLIKHL